MASFLIDIEVMLVRSILVLAGNIRKTADSLFKVIFEVRASNLTLTSPKLVSLSPVFANFKPRVAREPWMRPFTFLGFINIESRERVLSTPFLLKKLMTSSSPCNNALALCSSIESSKPNSCPSNFFKLWSQLK